MHVGSLSAGHMEKGVSIIFTVPEQEIQTGRFQRGMSCLNIEKDFLTLTLSRERLPYEAVSSPSPGFLERRPTVFRRHLSIRRNPKPGQCLKVTLGAGVGGEFQKNRSPRPGAALLNQSIGRSPRNVCF